MQKYDINKYSVSTILNWIKTKDIAIPEIQRPFVWEARKVRDLIDSLYRGFPVGYLIITQGHDLKLKDGSLSKGQRILIDGQQRVTALMTALLGTKVLDDEYKERVIKIAYNPFAEGDESIFEVQDQSHLKSKKWVADISMFFNDSFDSFEYVQKYCSENPEMNPSVFNKKVNSVRDILTKELGVIVSSTLDIETVTDVFIRINSKGSVLSQADYAMSKIAADENYGGNVLRKAIDYFCHIAVDPSFYYKLAENDKEFIESDLGKEMKWLKDDYTSIYDPSYEDIADLNKHLTELINSTRKELIDAVEDFTDKIPDYDYSDELSDIQSDLSELKLKLTNIEYELDNVKSSIPDSYSIDSIHYSLDSIESTVNSIQSNMPDSY